MKKDPVQEEKKKKSNRVYHGGSWGYSEDYINASERNRDLSYVGFSFLGLRTVRNVAPKERG